ncbi:MAG: metallophosphoesterase [Tagaea sp.]|nr:metallophosphoesterase [Tagaea sp.]
MHGYAGLLDALHARIRAHAEASGATRRVLIHLGDYVDRGPDSKGVLERLTVPWPGWERIDLMGNHEALMLDFIDGRRDGRVWFANGGLETLASFGVDSDRPEPFMRSDLIRAVGERGLRQLRNLRLSHRDGGYFFAHAGVRPGVPLDAQRAEDLLWIREAFLRAEFDPGAVIVHGHTIDPEPQDLPHRIGIDLGVYRHFRLGAVALIGATREFLVVEDVVRRVRS